MSHKMSLNDPWFHYVKSNQKLYEGRKYSEQMRSIKIGDQIILNHHTDPQQESFTRKVIGIHPFKTFSEGLSDFEKKGLLERILPGVESVEDGVNIYFRYVSLKTQEQVGVVFFELSD